MKKIFDVPSVEVKALSPDSEVMGVFSVASSVGQDADSVIVIKDDASFASDDKFSYWSSK